MSQEQYHQQNFVLNHSAGPMNDFNYSNLNLNLNLTQGEPEVAKYTEKRRDTTKQHLERLYKLTFIPRQGERDVLRTGGRQNKNEILGLTLSRLIKEKHLQGLEYSRDVELARGIQMKSNSGDFVMILRTDGRIVAMSDEVEHHLGKSMRSLYTQCINMFECLDDTDIQQLKTILDASKDLVQREHRLVCTLRLPKGKRPSRAREDVKAITMAGHFYSCGDSTSSSDKLFIARCEALVSRTKNGSGPSQPSMMVNDNTISMMKFDLNEDMSISFASPNVQEVLGYSRSEMIGNWLGRYLTIDDVDKFEAIRQKYFQQEQKQGPTSVCEIFDIYANNGTGRLSFLCQIRSKLQRRTKAIQLSIVAQLIDPSLKNDYLKHVQTEFKPIKAEQVNHVSSSISKTSEDTIMANSPSLAMGLLIPDNIEFTQSRQYSPFHRLFSHVAPVDINDEYGTEFFDFESNQSTDFNDWSKSIFDCQSEQGLENIFDEYLDILNNC